MKNISHKRGVSLVEVVITVSVFLVVILGLVGSFTYAVKTSLENADKVKATFLAEEGLEAMRLLRDTSWSQNIAGHVSGSSFYLSFDGANWSSTSSSAYIDGTFDRKLTINDVYRNSSEDIVSSGGTLDPNTKLVTAQVSWNYKGATSTRSLSTYLTNLFSN